MRSKEVLNLLRVTRPTLTKYVKSGKIKVIRKPNGHYEYDEESVYAFLNKDVRRKTYIYARVSTSKQKKDLENQIEMLKQFCFSNGYITPVFMLMWQAGSTLKNGKNFLPCWMIYWREKWREWSLRIKTGFPGLVMSCSFTCFSNSTVKLL